MPGMETADNPSKRQSLTQKYVETKFIYSEELIVTIRPTWLNKIMITLNQ